MPYEQVCNNSDTTGATCGAETTILSSLSLPQVLEELLLLNL